MGTNIEWTNETWNPTTGCDRISPGCANCYALTLAQRLKAMGQPRYQKDGGRASGPGFGLTLHEDVLTKPLSWKKPRRVFVNSMSDLFHEDVPFEFIDRVFAVMALTPQHAYQVLTKRPQRMREYMTQRRPIHWQNGGLVPTPADAATIVLWEAQKLFDEDFALGRRIGEYPEGYPTGVEWDWPLPNVWLGVTVENQHFADERIPVLLDTPAAVRFVSAEPLLGPVDLQRLRIYTGETPHEPNVDLDALTGLFIQPDEYWPERRHLDWVIVGGESGPRHRPFDPDWARSIIAQCRDAGVPVFVKQMGGLHPGSKLEDLPEDLRVREFPEVR